MGRAVRLRDGQGGWQEHGLLSVFWVKDSFFCLKSSVYREAGTVCKEAFISGPSG
jgi:hypothetical protein